MSERTLRTPSPIREGIWFFRAAGDHVYAVADAARDATLALDAARKFSLQTRSIFSGKLAPYLDEVAPHLIAIGEDSPYLDLWAEHLGNSAGILLLSPGSFDELWRHLRGIFVITDEYGEEFSFRFYDPRVLRVYLPTCTATEANEFFGPIQRILVESEPPGAMLRYRVGRHGVEMKQRVLNVSASSEDSRDHQ